MKVLLTSRAKKQLSRLPKMAQIAIFKKLRSLERKNTQPKKIKGVDNAYRVRVSDYRIVYRKEKETIYIVLIAHRKEVYETLKRII